VLQRPVESGQYTSFRLAEHLDVAGIAASIGSVGDAYDNALMESTIGLFKTELIKPQRPWKTLSQVELATLSGSTGTATADSTVR
jgi:transposase InsO family protein